MDESEDGIDRALHVAAAGVRFDGGMQDFKRLAEVASEEFRERLARIAMEKAVAAFENPRWSAEAFSG